MTYIEKLIEIEKNKVNLYGHLAKMLHNKLRLNIRLGKALEFAKETSVSNSLISKFIKYMFIEDWSTLRYIHNDVLKNKYTKTNNMTNDIKKFVEAIETANKILFIGTSTNLYSNKDFAHKLSRLDKWVITPESKYEQIGLTNLLTYKDLLIVNSISLQHEWMEDIIKKTKANVILITVNINKALKFKNILFVKVKSKKYDSSPSRTFTTKARRSVIEIYDNVYEKLIEKPENAQLLKLTAYN